MNKTVRTYGYLSSVLFLLSLTGCSMIFVRRLYTGKYSFLFLAWNLFLAWVPYLISLTMNLTLNTGMKRIKRIFIPPFFILWLVFFPNAPYMITDLIHFNNKGSFIVWFDLIVYAVFVLTGIFLGFLSLYIVNRLLEKTMNRLSALAVVMSILLISSYAIYMGRFVRHNSWDAIVSPFKIYLSFAQNINFQSIVFSFVFSVFLILVYALFYGLFRLEKNF